MTDEARGRRNTEMLATCHPAFATRVEAILAWLEDRGFRPRIQQAWRSVDEQQQLYRAGRSKVQYGFHNVTGPTGAKEALAVDVLDDDAPLAPGRVYLLALAIAADTVGCDTGLAWGLPPRLQQTVREIVDAGDLAAADALPKVGWDPCHVQPRHLTIAAARKGARPEATR